MYDGPVDMDITHRTGYLDFTTLFLLRYCIFSSVDNMIQTMIYMVILASYIELQLFTNFPN